MQYKQPHILINKASNNEVSIEIDDIELFDFIEDFLAEECSIEYSYITDSEDNKRIMHFVKKYSFEALKNAIQKIDKNEIERIYQLNN